MSFTDIERRLSLNSNYRCFQWRLIDGLVNLETIYVKLTKRIAMHDAQIRVAIAGAGGRMGRQLIQAATAWTAWRWARRWSAKVLPSW
jgi:hypothetical protein